MGGINSTPNYELLEGIPDQTCYKIINQGFSFTQVHSFSPGANFFQNLNIRPRIYPRPLQNSTPEYPIQEEFSPGDYLLGFNSELEGIQLNTKADAKSLEFSAKIPFHEDFTATLSTSIYPVFSLSTIAQCTTNVLNAKISLTNINFHQILLDSSIVFQVTDYLLVGSHIAYNSLNGALMNSLVSTLQFKNFVFTLNKDFQNNTAFSAKYYLNPSSYFGFSKVPFPYAPNQAANVYGLGYTFIVQNSIAQASIFNDLSLHGKFSKQISPQFIFGTGVSTNLLSHTYFFNIELQIETGQTL